MYDIQIKQLNKHYESFQEETDKLEYANAVYEYLSFIKNTNPFNLFIRKVVIPPQVKGLLSELNRLEEKHQFPISKHSLPYIFWEISATRLSLNFLYYRLIDQLEKEGYIQKDVVVISDNYDNQSICLIRDTPLCYVFDRKGTDRYKIVADILYGTETGKTAKEILSMLYKNNDDTSNVKKQIGNINRIFKDKTSAEYDIISTDETSHQNIYYLNRKNFIFKKEK